MGDPLSDPIGRLLDAIDGERADWRRVEVRPDDLRAVLSRLRQLLLADALQDAEADFIAAARRVSRLRAERGLRPLGLEDLPPAEHLPAGLDDRGEQRGDGEGERDGDAETGTHGEPPAWLDARDYREPRTPTARALLRDHFVISTTTDPRQRVADNLTTRQFVAALDAIEQEAVEIRHYRVTAAECERIMRNLTNGERGCANPFEHDS